MSAKAAKSAFLKKPAAKAPSRSGGVKRHGLGRGLDSLIPAARAPETPPPPAAPPAPAGAPFELPILDIERSPFQPRRDFKEEELRELADSMRNSGLVHPPAVRKNKEGKYELISGERRLRAALLAGWKKIPVTVVEADDLAAASMATAENLQREDLNPIEEAVGYKTLQDTFGLTQQEVADRVGKGRATVANSLRLLELPDEVKALVQSGLLSAGHAKVLLSVDSEKDRTLLARECVNLQLPVRSLERRVARLGAPVPDPRPTGTPDIPEGYVKTLADKLRRHLGCPVRLSCGRTLPGGKRVKGVLEIDFFDNDDLDRIVRMVGVEVD